MIKIGIVAVFILWSVSLLAGCSLPPDNQIFIASRNGETEKVKALLAKEPALVKAALKKQDIHDDSRKEPWKRDVEGDTPLHSALRNGHQDTADILITNGADVNVRNCRGETPLNVASSGGLVKSAETLISRGADVNAGNSFGESPLINAARLGHRDIVELLVTKGADVNAADNHGETPLSCAIAKDFSEISGYLLDHKAGLGNTGMTPLHLAAHCGSLKTAELLTTRGEKVNERDKYGNTPLHYSHGPVSLLLLEKGADIDARGKDGATPLLTAAMQHEPREVWLLISKGADVNVSDKAGNTPLHGAADGHPDLVRKLIEAGENVTAKNIYGLTPLHVTAETGDLSSAEMLISRGADINAGDRNRKTSLDYALETAGDSRLPEERRERCRKYADYLIGKGAVQRKSP